MDTDGRGVVVVASVDAQGRLFGKRVPERRFARLEALPVASCALAWDITQTRLEAAPAGVDAGWADLRLVPDRSTLRTLAWLPDTRLCLADVVHADGSPVEEAPRTVLRRQVEALAGDGIAATVATELEFYLYRGRPPAPGQLPAPTTDQHANFLVEPADDLAEWLAALQHALEDSGIPVEAIETEWGLGQWELNTGHGDPLAVADRHVVFKLAVRELARRHGLSATFMPRPSADDVGSSCHVHVSLRDRAGAPLLADPDALRHATGGVLAHLAELLVLYAPSINAYRRMRTPGFAGWGLTWSVDNRTATCRLLGESPDDRRVELRAPGADANPHLAIAGTLAAIRAGLRDRDDPGPELVGSAYEAPPAPLPQHLDAAADALDASAWARAALGDGVVDHYVRLARIEWDAFLTAVTDWERARYFDAL